MPCIPWKLFILERKIRNVVSFHPVTSEMTIFSKTLWKSWPGINLIKQQIFFYIVLQDKLTIGIFAFQQKRHYVLQLIIKKEFTHFKKALYEHQICSLLKSYHLNLYLQLRISKYCLFLLFGLNQLMNNKPWSFCKGRGAESYCWHAVEDRR